MGWGGGWGLQVDLDRSGTLDFLEFFALIYTWLRQNPQARAP